MLIDQTKELNGLKSMIKGIAKEVSSTKVISKKAEPMASHFASLQTSSFQESSETNDTRTPLFFSSKSTAVDPLIALDLNQ